MTSMTTDLEPITAYLEPEIKEGLKEWAKAEKRSLSNLAGYLLTQSYEEYVARQEKSSGKKGK